MTCTKEDFTPWFNGAIYKPSRPGVYQQRAGSGDKIGYQYWDGEYWYSWSLNVKGAKHSYSIGDRASEMYQDDDWRGITGITVPKKYSIVKVIAQTVETSDIDAYAREYGLQDWQIIELDSDGKTLLLGQPLCK